jgi:hypothetical protein
MSDEDRERTAKDRKPRVLMTDEEMDAAIARGRARDKASLRQVFIANANAGKELVSDK